MRKFKHGFLGKIKYYEEFKDVPPTTEERRKELLEKMKPWEFDPKRPVFIGGKPSGTPTPPPSVEVSIAPSSAVQYENVILTASTTSTSPTYIWTLTDFYDTSGNTISSYTGSVLTEGYFISTGSSNVSVVVIADEGSGSTSTFSVSEFSPSSINDMLAWIDFSDDSTITYRTGTTYVESITDKAGNWTLSQPIASYQPQILSASSQSTSIKQVASFDGLDNYLVSNGISPVSTYTAHTSFTMGTNTRRVIADRRGVMWEIGRTLSVNGLTSFADRRDLVLRGDLNNLFGIGYAFSQDRYAGGWDSWTDYPLVSAIRKDDATAGYMKVNGVEVSTFNTESDTWYVRDFVIGTQGNVDGTSQDQKLLGEYWESIHYTRTLTDEEINQIDRYLQYKWFGSMTY